MLPSPSGDLGMTSLPERKWCLHLDASLTQLGVAQVLLEIPGMGGPHALSSAGRHEQEGIGGQLGWVSRH